MSGTLNWKDRGDGHYDALASRDVGGKYFIDWVESYYSSEYGETWDIRAFEVEYQSKGSSGRGNISQVRIRTLALAQKLAQLHHDWYRDLIHKYGSHNVIPSNEWYEVGRALLAWQQKYCEDRAA